MTDQTMTPEQALEWLEGLHNTTGDQVCAEIEAGKAAEAARALRAALSRPAVPAGITVWLEGKRLARVGREAPESSGDSESRAAFAQLARLAPAVPSAHWWYRDSTDEWVLELNAAGDDMSITHRWPGKTKDDALRGMSAPAVPEWIPVSERLPEEGQCVLLACEYADAPVVGYQKHGTWWADTEHHEVSCGAYCYGGKVIGCLKDSHVTHWMPLPAPPSAEGDNE